MTNLSKHAKKALPVVVLSETFNLDAMLPEPAKVLQFPAPVEVFVGSCASCANLVYSGEEHQLAGSVDAPEITCSECLAEQREWKVVRTQVFAERMAA